MKRDQSRLARERLLAAADKLLYRDGVNSVGIDRLLAEAGVAKQSLYNLFGSKEELVGVYLSERHARWRLRVEQALSNCDTPRDGILCVFEVIGESVAEPGYRGCAFSNAAAEARPDGPIARASGDYRAWLHALFLELAQSAGALDPGPLARRLVLLYDGVAVTAAMDRDLRAPDTARSLVEQLLDSTLGPLTPSKPRRRRQNP
jgi:AcrR family transcriptional regulator